jgi:hypothetical protein
MGIGVLLEGFASAQQAPPEDFPQSDFTTGDKVRVAPGVVGRVVRPHGGADPSHVIIAPDGAGPHVKAPVGDVKLDTPAQHAARARREAAAALKQAQMMPGPGAPKGPPAAVAKPGVPAVKPAPAPVRESVELLLEAFTPAAPAPAAPPAAARPGETPGQSQAIARRQVAAAKTSLAQGQAWNATKHPRSQGGKFGYTTGGKRATRSPAASSRTVGQGSSGPLVKAIQHQLNIPADGKYGPQTRSAIERYQRQHQLKVDGVVGAQTLAALRGNPSARRIAPGPITSKQAKIRTHPAVRAKGTPAPARYGGGVVVGL